MARGIYQLTGTILIFCLKVILVDSYAVFIGGCANNTSPLVTSALTYNISSNLTNNYPGACLAFCERQNYTGDYVAVKGELCQCGKKYKSPVSSRPPKGCNETCPGHLDHKCGSKSTDQYSIYIVEKFIRVDPQKCLQYNRMVVVEADCNTNTQLMCYRANFAHCSNGGTWSDSAKDFNHGNCVPDQTYSRCHNKTCTFARASVPSTCKPGTPWWISGFGKFAPKKNCTNDSLPINGNWTYLYSNDNMETLVYSCDKGYTLVGDPIRVCMADGSLSGHRPNCAPDITTTSGSITSGSTTRTSSVNMSSSGPSMLTSAMVYTLTTSVQSSSENKDEEGGLNAGGIAGIISNISSDDHSSGRTRQLIGTVVGAIVLLVICGVVCWKKKNKRNAVGDSHGEPGRSSRIGSAQQTPGNTKYSNQINTICTASTQGTSNNPIDPVSVNALPQVDHAGQRNGNLTERENTLNRIAVKEFEHMPSEYIGNNHTISSAEADDDKEQDPSRKG